MDVHCGFKEDKSFRKTKVLNQMVASGDQITEPLVQRLSPYMTKHIKRWQHVLDIDTVRIRKGNFGELLRLGKLGEYA